MTGRLLLVRLLRSDGTVAALLHLLQACVLFRCVHGLRLVAASGFEGGFCHARPQGLRRALFVAAGWPTTPGSWRSRQC